MHSVQLSILICSFNTHDETLACLESVEKEICNVSAEVIVVDNGSSDGSAEAIRERFPNVRLIASPRNLGFAAANNLAATEAKGEYLLLLNPDTVLLCGCLHNILSFAKTHPTARVYGGRTFFADMSLNRYSCHGAPTLWSQFCKGTGLSAVFRNLSFFDPEGLGHWQRDTVREVDCISGCFLLIERSLWNELKGFDLDFFMYGEDTDLCMRARKLGARPLICPDAKLIHHGGRSERVRSDMLVRLFRAKHQLFAKHWPSPMVRYGVATLKAWAFTRYIGLTLLSIFHRPFNEAAREWGEVYARRHEFARRETLSPPSREHSRAPLTTFEQAITRQRDRD